MKRVLLVVMVLMSLVYAVSCENDKNTTKLDDINIFINEEYYSGYEEDENMWWKTTAGENARDFFPPYEEIQYKYSDINFYVYANNNFFAFPDATLVLELVFDNAVDYEAAKKDIYET